MIFLEFVLILAASVIYALVHLANGWLFQSFEVSPHVNWIYLPAFLQVFYVLVLGRLNGFIAIFLGGLMVGNALDEPHFIWVTNSVCAALAPILAYTLMTRWLRRPIDLTSLRDLLQLTFVYGLFITLLHHLFWTFFDPLQWHEPVQIVAMAVGDWVGCLIGAGIMKAAVDRIGLPEGKFNPPSKD